MVSLAKPSSVRLDTSVPALLVRVGHYPIHHGSLGVVQTLGRAGVPTYAVTEGRFTPLSVSRHLKGRFIWRNSGHAAPDELVERLRSIGQFLGRPAVAVATDDEAAILLAEHAAELSDYLLIPPTPPALPRLLASKRGLYELCGRHGVPTPRTLFPKTQDDVRTMARALMFPVVIKNVAAWTRITAPIVPGTTIVRDELELLRRFAGIRDLSGMLIQEYIPLETAEDWFTYLYCDSRYDQRLLMVGKKAYAWPPGRGITADARSAANPTLARMTQEFCRGLGYQGIADLDWRYDRRDGQYKLVDFNPRVGAQFRFGQTSDGLDMVSGLHLSMTGREIPCGQQDLSRRLIVEHVYLPSRALHRLARYPRVEPIPKDVQTAGAWIEGRDPLPVIMMSLWFILSTSKTVASLLLNLVKGMVRRVANRMKFGRLGSSPAPERFE